MTFMRITSPRIASSQASRRTVRERVKAVEELRGAVSGVDSALQLSREIEVHTKEDCERLLDELFKQPGKFKVQISPTASLALKSDLQIPWTKMRAMRRLHVLHYSLFMFT